MRTRVRLLASLLAGRVTFAPTRRRDGLMHEAKDRLGIFSAESVYSGGVPNGIRTRVLALKGPRPRPLDDGDSR